MTAPIELIVRADHFQVLIGDSVEGPLVDTSSLWNSSDPIPSVPGTEHLIALPVARFGGTAQVQLIMQTSSVTEQGAPEWELIGDFKLDLPSGTILLWGPETVDLESAASVVLSKGRYVGEAFATGRELVTDEEVLEGPDRYRIVLQRKEY
jgi:hypothetical protein